MDLHDHIIVGTGISGLLCGFFISKVYPKKKILLITKSNKNLTNFSTTWKVGIRHISSIEGINFLSENHIKDIQSPVSYGGQLCKKTHHTQEEEWTQIRKQLCKLDSFCDKVTNFYKSRNLQSVGAWRDFFAQNPSMKEGIDFKKGIHIASNQETLFFESSLKKVNHYDVVTGGRTINLAQKFLTCHLDKLGFSLDIKKFCAKVINELKKHGAKFLYDTEICKVNFDKNKKLSSIESVSQQKFYAKNYLFCLGSYGQKLLNYFDLGNKISNAIGIWMKIKDAHISTPFKYYSFKENKLETYQNYTPTQNNCVIASGGIGWVGQDLDNIDKDQLQAMLETQKKIATQIFPKSEVIIENANCPRPFSADNLPVFLTGKTSFGGHYTLESGSATSGASCAVLNAIKICNMIS